MKLDKKIIEDTIDNWGIKKRHLVNKCGVAPATFYKYISGLVDVPHEFVVKLAFSLPYVNIEMLLKEYNKSERNEAN